MAKGDVTLKFDAQTAAFVQAVEAAREKIEALGNTAHKTHSAFSKMGEGVTELATKVTGLYSALGLAEQGMEGLKKGVEEYFKVREERTNTLTAQTQTVNGALAASRQMGSMGEVRQGLEAMKSIGGMVVNPEDRNKLFASISAASPYASAQDKLAATRAALLGESGGMDTATATQLGSTFAVLSRERRKGGAFEGKTDEELQDLAYAHPEGIEGRNLTFFNRAKDKNQALQLISAASRSGEAAKALIAIQQAGEEDFDPGKVAKLQHEIRHAGHKATEDQKRELKLAQLHPEERIAAMLNDETLVAPNQRAAMRDLKAQMGQLPGRMSLSGDVRRIMGSEDEQSRLTRQRRNQDNITAQMDEVNAEQSARDQIQFEKRKAIFRAGLPDVFKWAAGTLAHMEFDPGSTNVGAQGAVQAPRNEVHEAIKDLHETVKEQTNTMRTRRDTTLSNNNEGQK
jgi:hypothetical protein